MNARKLLNAARTRLAQRIDDLRLFLAVARDESTERSGDRRRKTTEQIVAELRSEQHQVKTLTEAVIAELRQGAVSAKGR